MPSLSWLWNEAHEADAPAQPLVHRRSAWSMTYHPYGGESVRDHGESEPDMGMTGAQDVEDLSHSSRE